MFKLNSRNKIVGFADNGKIAIKKAEELQPDIILVDLFMQVEELLKEKITFVRPIAIQLYINCCRQARSFSLL